MVDPDEPIPVGGRFLPFHAGPADAADPPLDLPRIPGKRVGEWVRDSRRCFRLCGLALLPGHFQSEGEEIADGKGGMPGLQRVQLTECLLPGLRGMDGGPGEIFRFSGSLQSLPPNR